MTGSDVRILVRPDATSVAVCAASFLTGASRRAVAGRGVFTLALSGGNTPIPLFRLLRSRARTSGAMACDGSEMRRQAGEEGPDWSRTRLFWVDERCVPPDHEDSNFGLARRELLAGLPHMPEFFRMRGEENPEAAASAYETLLRSRANFPASAEAGVPSLDCVVLGIGADGHTASLFPGSPALGETRRLVVAAEGPAPGGAGRGGLGPDASGEGPGAKGGRLCRLTLTLPALNAAKLCLIVVCGSGKHAALRRALDVLAPPDLPIQRVRPLGGRVIWIVDATAARGR